MLTDQELIETRRKIEDLVERIEDARADGDFSEAEKKELGRAAMRLLIQLGIDIWD